MEPITPVILCGGSGSRLWPRSRPERPKPFLPLVGERTLFREALQRTRHTMFANPIIVVGAAHVGLAEAQARGFDVAQTIVEPEPKQTAAAIALAALGLSDDSVLIVCPSDHFIEDTTAFRTAAAKAANVARDGWLVCLGVVASSPDPRFGYIRRGDPVGDNAFRVAEFVEKPDWEKAAGYASSGLFAWNAGIFVFRAGDYLQELEKFRPAMVAAARRSVSAGKAVGDCFHPDRAAFAAIEPESVDYALMENTDRAALVMAAMGWSDVGNWDAVYRMRQKDELGNALRGPVQLVGCENVLVDTDGPKVHVIGLDNVVVVVEGDDILVASAAGAAELGKLTKGQLR
jgi:mannose-1-phosphate guanylyltransferase